MEKLDNYDVKALFNQTYGGTFTNLDPEEEKKRTDEFTLKEVDKVLQPKMTTIKEVVTAKKLPTIARVEAKGAFGFTDFYEGLFQNTNAEDQTDAEPGKIISNNPTVDNLRQAAIAKH